MAELTPEDRLAAEARGCRFLAATPQQVATMAMQRRVFWVEGQAWLAMRRDGFFETAATLQRLLREPLPEPAQEAEAAVAAPGQPETPPVEAAPAPEALIAATKPPAADPAERVKLRQKPRPAASATLARAGHAGPEARDAAALAETARLVCACLSGRSMAWQELDALIRGTHQAVLRMRSR
ncbi:hypothetical protein ACFOD4_19300 [Pseudoroseomonas globiformis]|uniref:Uncharacterized protein n=1 Tax=Teichococcus globiformis TaxID=2307229 RepID=A0ABV7G6Z0_9PROT